MYRKIENIEAEANALRRQNEDLKNRLKKMQDVIRRYQIEKQQLMKEHGVTRTDSKIGVDV